MARIFISYSRSDKPFIDQFVPLIRRVYGNDSLWFDDDIHGGADWWQMILHEIGDCELFIYLISTESLESSYCQAELHEALRLNKQILPVIVRRLKPAYPGNIDADLAETLRKTHYVDMSGGFRKPDTIATLYAAVKHLLDAVPQQALRPMTATPTPEPPVPDKDTGIRVAYIGGIFLLVSVVIAGIFGLWQGVFANTSTPDPQSTTAIAAVDTELPTLTATITLSPTITSTPDVGAAAQTVIAQETAQAIVDAATATAARATEDTVLNLTENANLTATATQWTDTPTPNYTASVQAVLTEWANGTATQNAVNATATATLWTVTPTSTYTPTHTATPTPTDTNTPTHTPTSTPTPTPLPEQLALTPVTRNADWTPVERDFDGVTMVLVPAGCFMMGSTDGESDEQPVEQVCFDEPFWIDKYEVTNAQYGSRGCEERSSEPDQPRNCVDWFDARNFCETRDARLPTEAEWEYAARGSDALVYPWGNTYNAANVIGEDDPTYGRRGTAPVGSRPSGASWVGALDMIGNVWEWTSSLYMEYPYGNDHESTNDTSSRRVLHGGSFLDSTLNLRAANRNRVLPDSVLNSLGFRCARDFE